MKLISTLIVVGTLWKSNSLSCACPKEDESSYRNDGNIAKLNVIRDGVITTMCTLYMSVKGMEPLNVDLIATRYTNAEIKDAPRNF